MRLGSELDVRHVVPSIRVPTLVMHAPGDPIVPLRRAAGWPSRFQGARFVELTGQDHVPWFDVADQVSRRPASF